MIVFGLTEEQLRKSTMTPVDEVPVHDGKGGYTNVRKGDRVKLMLGASESTLEYLGPGLILSNGRLNGGAADISSN